MAIDTNTKKVSMLEWCMVWEPGLPLLPGAIGQDDQQQLLWDYPGILWGEISISAPAPSQAWGWDKYVR